MKIKHFTFAILAVVLAACSSTPDTANVSEAEMRAEYEKLAQQAPLEYKVRHIIVERQYQAEEALQRIKKGESFESVALDVSTDPGSKKQGGDLGWSYPENFPPEFSAAMIALSPSGLSASPVKSRFGWHVIELIGTRRGPLPPFESVREDLAKRVRAKLKAGQAQP